MTKIAQTPDARIIWPAEHAPASALVFAQNVIDIAATPEAVWSQLVDCVTWPQWSIGRAVQVIRLVDNRLDYGFDYLPPCMETRMWSPTLWDLAGMYRGYHANSIESQRQMRDVPIANLI
jgi:hypothetical protein